jgi:hypothetical protein
MKLPQLLLAAAVACASASAQGANGDPRTPVVVSTRLQLHAEMESPTVKLGEPVVVKFQLKNVFSAAIRITDAWASYDYELVVTDASGKEPPRTALGLKILRGDYTLLRSIGLDLDPGEQIEASIDIATIYLLTQPGTYSVRAMRNKILGDAAEASSRNHNELARSVEKAASNVVQFTITSP